MVQKAPSTSETPQPTQTPSGSPLPRIGFLRNALNPAEGDGLLRGIHANRCGQRLLVPSHQAPIPMGGCARLTSAKLALLSGLSATSGAPHRQCLLLGDFHGYMMQRCWREEWSILTNAATRKRDVAREKI